MMFQGSKGYIAQICEVHLICEVHSNIYSILFGQNPVFPFLLLRKISILKVICMLNRFVLGTNLMN